MYKFALLFIFLAVCINWIYQPLDYEPTEEKINQYRPSKQMKPAMNLRDSVYPAATNYKGKAQALFIFQNPVY